MKHILFIIIFSLTSCSFAPEYKRPEVDFKEGWQSKSDYINNEVIQDRWWELLADDLLNKLVEEALLNNYDVAIALANIEQSRAVYNIAKSDLLPDVAYQAQARHSSFGNTFNAASRHEHSSLFDAAWELDIWGRARLRKQAAKERYLAEIEMKRAMMLSVAAEVVTNYVQLRAFQKRFEIMQENIALLDQTIKLTEVQNNVGVADNFDVVRAKAQQDILKSMEPNIKADISVTIYRLALLLGKEPSYLSSLLSESKDLPTISSEISVSIPSELLRRRPDIKRAEHMLIASNAEIGGAIANFLPSFSLTALLGHRASHFDEVFTSGSGSFHDVIGINVPLFRGGELRANYKNAKAENQEAILEYKKTVINALYEVEAGLMRYAKEIETKKLLEQVVADNQKVVDLAKERYSAGYTDVLQVIDAERNLILARNSDLQSEVNILINMVSLYKALGGGVE